MGKAITKIVYKPDTQSSDEFIIIVNPEEVRHTLQITLFNPTHSSLMQYKKYKAGGESRLKSLMHLTDQFSRHVNLCDSSSSPLLTDDQPIRTIPLASVVDCEFWPAEYFAYWLLTSSRSLPSILLQSGWPGYPGQTVQATVRHSLRNIRRRGCHQAHDTERQGTVR